MRDGSGGMAGGYEREEEQEWDICNGVKGVLNLSHTFLGHPSITWLLWIISSPRLHRLAYHS